MTRLVALALVFCAVGTASAEPITYTFLDNETGNLLFTFTLNSPPAASAPGWSTTDTADLTSFVVNEQSFLPTGFNAGEEVPGPANSVIFLNDDDPDLLPQFGNVVFANSAPFGLGTFAALNFSGSDPSNLNYVWTAVTAEGIISQPGTGRIVGPLPVPGVPEPATLAVFGVMAAGAGVAVRRKKHTAPAA